MRDASLSEIRPTTSILAAEPELEDFVEFLGKVRRSGSLGDAVGVRAFAREAAVSRRAFCERSIQT